MCGIVSLDFSSNICSNISTFSWYALSQRIHLSDTHLHAVWLARADGPALFRSTVPMAFTTWKWLVRLNTCTLLHRRGLVYSKLLGGLHTRIIKAQPCYNLLSMGSRLGYQVLLFRVFRVSFWVCVWVFEFAEFPGVSFGVAWRWCTKAQCSKWTLEWKQ